MGNLRGLAAGGLSGVGPGIIIPGVARGVLGATALGVLTVLRSQSLGMTAFGIALIGLGVNYIPLLIHAIELVRRSAVEAAIADEACDRRALYAKYRRQSLWLLFPFAVGFAALLQVSTTQ